MSEAVPVTGPARDEIRDKLAAALMEARLIRWIEPELAGEFADAVLPTVRALIADELRAAAEAIEGDGQDVLAVAMRRIYSADLLHARADALEQS